MVVRWAMHPTGRRPFDVDQTTVTVGLNIPVVTLHQDNAAAACAGLRMAADGQEPVVVMLPYDLADAPVDDAGHQFL